MLSGVRTVGKNGYLVIERMMMVRSDTYLPTIDAVMFDQILAEAEQGQRPPFFKDHEIYFKVDPKLTGQKLWQIVFEPLSSWFKDGVVVDGNNNLVEREIFHSLSRHRWKLQSADQTQPQIKNPEQMLL